jgi:hypothetical protein
MPLTFRDRGTSGTQLDVMSGNVRIATLWKNKLSLIAGGGQDWRWSFTMSAGPPGFQIHDRAATKGEAQSVIEEQWIAWLDAAGLVEK